MFKLGELASNIETLKDLRDKLTEDVNGRRLDVTDQKRLARIERERWETLHRTASRIAEACDSHDLEELASSVREMKNRLRRPSIRKELARLEDKDKKPEGECKCAECGKLIDQSRSPCVEEALCVDCALKKKTSSGDEEEKKKEKEKEKEKEKAKEQ
jgi:hypothetical protein